jgi:DNA-binding IclR family transcriptional regulator
MNQDPFAKSARAEITILDCLAELRTTTLEAIAAKCQLSPGQVTTILKRNQGISTFYQSKSGEWGLIVVE